MGLYVQNDDTNKEEYVPKPGDVFHWQDEGEWYGPFQCVAMPSFLISNPSINCNVDLLCVELKTGEMWYFNGNPPPFRKFEGTLTTEKP